MQASNDVKLRYGFAVPGGSCFVGLLQRHRVSAGSVFLTTERAKAAGCDADVGRINMPIDVEVRSIAVQPFTNVVRQPSDSQNVTSAVEQKGVVPGETLSG